MSNQSSVSRWQAMEAAPEDSGAIRALFEKVFKHEMSISHWNWKYEHQRGEGVVVKSGDEVVAFYGAVKRRVVCRGEPTNTLQCVDTMVDTSQRGSLSKKGPYYLAATTFLKKYIGYNKPYLFGFGFPNARVMKLGEILSVQADIGAVVEVEWKPKAADQLVGSEIRLSAPEHTQLIDSLWQRMVSDLADRIVIIRDLDYLLYRYNENPSHDYQVYLVGSLNEVKGLIVCRVEIDRLLILDLLGPLANYPLLIEFAQDLAARKGLTAVSTWITEPDTVLFQTGDSSMNEEVLIKDIGVRIPTSVCAPGPSPDSLHNAWFLLAGDTDFL
ncbi:MAG: hypothetical protein AB8B95_03600 [Pseudohongiellaceae bacterium]